MGDIVGVNARDKAAYMPAFADDSDPSYNLYKVKLKSGLGKIHKEGNEHTVEWYLDSEGNVVAREDYNKRDQLHRIFAYKGMDRKIVYENKAPARQLKISAVARDSKHLVFIRSSKIHKMSLIDGSIIEADFNLPEYNVDRLSTDMNGRLKSVIYGDLQPFHDVLDPVVAGHYRGVEATFPSSEVSFISSTQDGDKLLVEVSGIDAAGSFMLYDGSKKSIVELGRRYPSIDKSQIGEISTVAYKARDGLKIPSILTWPVGVTGKTQRTKLPLIVLPHDRPAAYDSVAFKWWPQYLASRGYLVLQPNFRGSRAFGDNHQELGNGKWGREMQDDVSDGVKAMIKAGYADPDRICIMGASYGGYSALAGGVFSPELYRCVIAVGAVSDIPAILNTEKDPLSEELWVTHYWNNAIGDSKTERDKLGAISPLNFVANVQSPTLLIHGKGETIVPASQSAMMHESLTKAGKNSKLIELEADDHWLPTVMSGCKC